MSDAAAPPAAAVAGRCEGCGTELPPGFLACPGCRRLVHAPALKTLADAAEAASAAGDVAGALGHWRRALLLLPADARQHAAVLEKIRALGIEADRASPAPSAAPADGSAARRGGIAAVVVAVGIFLLTKGKLLVLGFTKLGTLSSMLLSFGVLWSAYGWGMAAGLIVSIYVHEMGHVAALRRYGFPASAPMFIPGLGAFVLLAQHPANAREDARIGLAGPVWGLGAALASYGVFLATGAPVWGVIAKLGAFINLLNLIPVWQLDGGRAFSALTRNQRWHALGAIVAAFLVTDQRLLLGLAAGVLYQIFARPAPEEEDAGALGLYAFLVFALAAFALLPPPLRIG